MDERLNLPSASSFSSDVACPGRQNLLRQLREQNGEQNGDTLAVDDPAMAELAARGTRIHKARSTGNTFELSEPELDAYQKACALERQAVEDWMLDNDIAAIADPIVEERLWLNSEDTLEPILSGQTDVVWVQGQHALVDDWKSGSALYVGAAAKNWQLRIYALLVWKEWPQLKRIRVALIMPERFGQRIDVADYNEYSLQHIEQAVLHAIWQSRQPDAPLRAGPWCRFCPARAACPEAGRYATLPAVMRAGDLDSTLELIKTMAPEDALAVWQRRREVAAIMGAIEARLKALPEDELDRLGLQMKPGRRMENVVDKISAFNALREAGFPTEDILNALDFGKGAITALFQQRTNCRDSEAAAWWENLIGEFTEKGRAKPSLVEKP